MVLDGEMVVFNEEGMPDFDAVQNYNGHETQISYCVFDILWLDGYDLKGLPLRERKEILKNIVGDSTVLKYSESFDDGPGLYRQMIKLGLEGVVAKKKDSAYSEGIRGNEWLKTPTRIRQEFVIGGWAESDKARSFRSILFGAYNDKGEFEWIGRSGGGYKEAEMPGLLKKLEAIETKASPFVNKVLDTKGAKIHWVKPKLVANFEFAAWTKSGRIRKPATWLGLRKDKKPADVVREVPKATKQIETENEEVEESTTQAETQSSSNWPKLEKIKVTSQDILKVDGCDTTLTDVERKVWKGIPKGTLIQYYNDMADLILPYLQDRPLSLHVKPNGATAPGLYIKDMEGREPDCAEIFSDKRRHLKGRQTRSHRLPGL
jgi:bifunctional non-homologous end joining protein LigD